LELPWFGTGVAPKEIGKQPESIFAEHIEYRIAQRANAR
jgi:hypothetical protein